jgi:hypothetical protein
MKKPSFKFETQDLQDKVKITLFVNGKKEGSLYKMKENEFSSYFSVKEAQESLINNYLILNDEGEL